MNPYSRFQPGQMQPAPQARPPSGPAGVYGGGAQPQPYTARVQPQQMQRQPRPQPQAPAQSGGGGMSGMLGGIASGLSDKNSKEEIRRLESTNDALTDALADSHQGGNMPDTEYPKMPANTRFSAPSRASFADSPAANTVAAQNVGLTKAQPGAMAPPPAIPANMQPGAMPQAQQAAVPNMGFRPPDMSQLDNAYRRFGQQQGGG